MQFLDRLFGIDQSNPIEDIKRDYTKYYKLSLALQYDDKVMDTYIEEYYKQTGQYPKYKQSLMNPCLLARIMRPCNRVKSNTKGIDEDIHKEILERQVYPRGQYSTSERKRDNRKRKTSYEATCELCELYKRRFGKE